MSAEQRRLKVVLCWHMHQPDYRGSHHGEFQLPWVYLHGIKDYVDMAAHLEANPDARAVVNFAPILLEQVADYARQIKSWCKHAKLIRDPLLAALAGPGFPADMASRKALIRACLRANEKNLIGRFDFFRQLSDLANRLDQDDEMARYVNDQYMADLLVWYHIAWMGESVHQNEIRVRSLIQKESGFDADDRRRLVEVIGELMSGIIGRYRRLAEEGRVELAVSPYAHPILPLMLDMQSASEAMPDVELPRLASYPGGEARARWHIRKAIASFTEHFGSPPRGCWPSEGAISEETLKILEEEGFSWTASGQQVLHSSLSASVSDQPLPEQWLHSPYRLNEGRLNCFFRDDGLSDLIGFTYADWHADDAVGNLVQHLETIADANGEDPDRVVSIIMDGENAWEYYPMNGSYFLTALYERLVQHPRLELTTFSDYLARCKSRPAALTRVVAGSWVYGTFSTWIGDPDKNRGWEMLGEAKEVYDRVLASGRLNAKQVSKAEKQLATCEGSDWFWWFGDYNPGTTVSDFERLFRQQLKELYKMLGEKSPEYLSQVFAHGSGDPALGGVMKKN